MIGANNSSNSLRLVEVAKQYGANKSKLIESIDSFNLSEIENIKILGITASASAPEILVQNFIKKIEEKFFVNLHKPDYKKEDVNFKIPQQLKVD